MPAKQIRAAVVNYFQGTPGLSQLTKDEPVFTPGQAWVSNGLDGTAGFVHLDQQSEEVVTLRGPGLQERAVTYDVALVLQYQYRIPPDGSPLEADWVDGLDDLLDAIVEKLRADPTLGAPQTIFNAGTGHMDVKVQRTMPAADKGKVWAVSYIVFTVVEIIIPTV